MRDRQEFERTVLPNGIVFYSYKLDSPIVRMEIQLPVGAAHSYAGNDFLEGSVHFLEHLQLIRSHGFPKPHQLNRELGLRGGHFNANTFRSKTTYWIDVPASEVDFASEALIDRVYHPFFATEDIERERTVIKNERDREKFYPGHNPASLFYRTQFMVDKPYSLEQLYGSDEDLAQITPDRLRAMHRTITASQNTVAIAVGNSDFKALRNALSTINTSPGLLNRRMHDAQWVDRNFRLVGFESITRPTLELAWIYPRVHFRERTAIEFLLGALTNNVHGTLYEELRHKRGWVYNIRHFITSHKQTIFGISLPVNSVEQIEQLRPLVHETIQNTIHNQKRIEQEINRRLNNQVYNYQTASSIMQQASLDLISNKRIITEREWQDAIRTMAEPAARQAIVDRFFSTERIGELGLIPA